MSHKLRDTMNIRTRQRMRGGNLGLADDSETILLAAVEYLRSNKGRSRCAS